MDKFSIVIINSFKTHSDGFYCAKSEDYIIIILKGCYKLLCPAPAHQGQSRVTRRVTPPRMGLPLCRKLWPMDS